MIALYSVNLRVMGKANLSLLRIDTIFTEMQALTGLDNVYTVLAVGAVSALICVILSTGSSVRKSALPSALPAITSR